MSLNNKPVLSTIAKILCRQLRLNSTKAEKKLWEVLRGKKFYGKKFYRQYPIYHDVTGKETFFIADFFCFEKKLIIELDGKYHKYRLKEDEERTKILNHLGLKVIRFRNEEISRNLKGVLDIIKNNLLC